MDFNEIHFKEIHISKLYKHYEVNTYIRITINLIVDFIINALGSSSDLESC